MRQSITVKAKSVLETKSFYNSTIPSNWTTPEFGNVFFFLKSFSFSREQLTDKKTIDEIRNIHYGDIHATYENEILDFEAEKTVPYLIDGLMDKNNFDDEGFPALQDGDLIIADASEDYEGICDCVELKNLNGSRVVSGLHTFAARGKKEKIALGFRTYVLNNSQVVRELRRLATGISVYGVSKTNLAKVKIPLPPLHEQKNIANILSTWDNSIAKTQKLILELQRRNKWFMHQLLTGKLRAEEFVKNEQKHKTSLGELPVDWKLTAIKNISTPIKNSFTPKQDELYQQIGIRSHTKGIFYKEKVTGKALGEKSVFWIEPNCFIVNIVFAWEHAIAKTTDNEIGMIASHRFPMFKPKEGIIDLDYLLFFFKSPRGKHLLGLASPGGAGRNKTLGQSEFLKLQIPVPSLNEQIAIASLLNTAGKEIQLLKEKLIQLKKQKKGLMQILLTGKKRLK